MNFMIGLFLIPIILGKKHDCPGGSFKCDDSATCCELLDKSYGCCPLKDGVCCDDHIHCCPVNTKCSTGMCIQQDFNKLTNSSGHLIRADNVTCPGGEFTCPDATTCCEGDSPGMYGCCPMEHAVCCQDKQHCCPSGTTCNLSHQTCDGDNYVTPMYDSHKKLFKSHDPMALLVETYSDEISSVVCPGSSFQCPDSYTCCKLQSGEWGCCPFPKATCCKDGFHCCPENMNCDETSTHCSQGYSNVTSFRNVPATPVKTENIVCPDKSQCKDSMTCCQLSDTKYGCCQYYNAVCCSDRLHCCPSGNRCDVKEKRCVSDEHWLLNSIL